MGKYISAVTLYRSARNTREGKGRIGGWCFIAAVFLNVKTDALNNNEKNQSNIPFKFKWKLSNGRKRNNQIINNKRRVT
jgi:hypothetical protein